MRYVLALLLLISASFATEACEGNITQQLPAVVGSNGGLINITLSLMPGSGDSYFRVRPLIGYMTQQSIEQAVDYAYKITGRQLECDVLFSFGDDYMTDYVDGPSAGAALTVMAYALLEDKELRNDTVITGTIDRFGTVGPVGGTYEKAKSAALDGASYFITPPGTFYETLLLRNVQRESNITVLEAEKIEDVIAFMTENKSIEQKAPDAKKREIPELERYHAPRLVPFAPLAYGMMDIEKEALERIIPDDDETKEIVSYFENELTRQQALADQGYVFSSANEAFLDYIDISTIAVLASGEIDLPRKKGEAGICLTSIKRPMLTDDNFEWVVGADLRQAWAYDMINKTDVDGDVLADEEYGKYHELMYAQAWCHVAKELIANMPEGGNEIDEAQWIALADKKLEDAKLMGAATDAARSRMEIAEESYEKGRYGASIMDAVYVIAMEQSAMDIYDGNATEENIAGLLNESRETLWGNVYQSHGAFLYEAGEMDTAYNTLLFAKGLDEAILEMENAESVQEEEQAVEEEPDLLVLAIAGISLFLFIIVLILITRGAYGDKSQRYRKNNRA